MTKKNQLQTENTIPQDSFPTIINQAVSALQKGKLANVIVQITPTSATLTADSTDGSSRIMLVTENYSGIVEEKNPSIRSCR